MAKLRNLAITLFSTSFLLVECPTLVSAKNDVAIAPSFETSTKGETLSKQFENDSISYPLEQKSLAEENFSPWEEKEISYVSSVEPMNSDLKIVSYEGANAAVSSSSLASSSLSYASAISKGKAE